MKSKLPYIILGLVAVGILMLVATGNYKKNRHFDGRITLRKSDKIPYGSYVAYQNLKSIFPGATIYTDRHEPGYWDSLSNYEKKQAVIILAGRFAADEFEMKQLIKFAEKGNDVFVIAMEISATAERMLGCDARNYYLASFFESGENPGKDTLTLQLKDVDNQRITQYRYPGRSFNGYFNEVDTVTTHVLGTDAVGRANFIHLQAGDGNFYINMAPVAFSNYFLLHGQNIGYYEKALSYIRPDVQKIVWDEYYLNKKSGGQDNEKKKGWFTVLMNLKNEEGKKPFRAAFWLAILLLLLYVLMEMRRKQRYIPVVAKPRNDSMDFVKTIGRLYYDKGDHRNLCLKMSSYFLEYVRNKYKLPTSKLDEEFIMNLRHKSGVEEPVVRSIISFIKYAEDTPAISQPEVNEFHELLEIFYKTA